MHKTVKTIPPFHPFPIQPDRPEEMNEKYPFMHNLFKDEGFQLVSLKGTDQVILMAQGTSHHMDDLENAILYGGILGRMHLNAYPDNQLMSILLVNGVQSGGVPEADPEDGILQVVWPGKTLRYQKDGKPMEQDVDILMTYIDMEKLDRLMEAYDFSDLPDGTDFRVSHDMEAFWQRFKPE